MAYYNSDKQCCHNCWEYSVRVSVYFMWPSCTRVIKNLKQFTVWCNLLSPLSVLFLFFVFICVLVSSGTDMFDIELGRVVALGFTGCLSAVYFNSISPLKAALLQPDRNILITGPLTQSNCGSLSSPQLSVTTHSLPGMWNINYLCATHIWFCVCTCDPTSPILGMYSILLWLLYDIHSRGINCLGVGYNAPHNLSQNIHFYKWIYE